jgi:tRNA (guanine-N7-)-methyltransferase
MTVRVRHHVNPFHEQLWNIAPPPLRLAPVAVAEPGKLGRSDEAPDEAPIDVELGCADAQFLFELAARDPVTHHIGIEIRRPWVEDVNLRAAELGHARLRAIYAHINVDLPTLFRHHKVRRFYINFPDPWFKRAQHKRRLVTPELAADLLSLLRPDGEIFFQSDIFELALDALAIFESEPGLQNSEGEWTFLKANPYGARSLREDYCKNDDKPVWRMRFKRRRT